MKKYTNSTTKTLGFEVGDQVLLKLTPHIWKKIYSETVRRSLIPKYNGCFKNLKKVGQGVYNLQLLEG